MLPGHPSTPGQNSLLAPDLWRDVRPEDWSSFLVTPEPRPGKGQDTPTPQHLPTGELRNPRPSPFPHRPFKDIPLCSQNLGEGAWTVGGGHLGVLGWAITVWEGGGGASSMTVVCCS